MRADRGGPRTRRAALALVAEAQAEMVAAVEEADDITIERYTEIGPAAEGRPGSGHAAQRDDQRRSQWRAGRFVT